MALSHFFRTPHIALKMKIQCNKSVTICISEVASKAKIKCLLKWFSSSYRLFYSLRATLWVPKISVMLLYRYLKLHFFSDYFSLLCPPLCQPPLCSWKRKKGMKRAQTWLWQKSWLSSGWKCSRRYNHRQQNQLLFFVLLQWSRVWFQKIVDLHI